jgi:transcriptional regulator with XRE-family HTH domain
VVGRTPIHPVDVELIRNALAANESQSAIARRTGISQSTISKIHRGVYNVATPNEPDYTQGDPLPQLTEEEQNEILDAIAEEIIAEVIDNYLKGSDDDDEDVEYDGEDDDEEYDNE